jgi:hypothetical protein
MEKKLNVIKNLWRYPDERFHDEFPGKKVSKFERKNIKISSSKRVKIR